MRTQVFPRFSIKNFRRENFFPHQGVKLRCCSGGWRILWECICKLGYVMRVFFSFQGVCLVFKKRMIVKNNDYVWTQYVTCIWANSGGWILQTGPQTMWEAGSSVANATRGELVWTGSPRGTCYWKCCIPPTHPKPPPPQTTTTTSPS